MTKIKVSEVQIEYNSKNIRIVDSYKINDKSRMNYILNCFLDKTNFKSKRTIASWIKEWKAHNRLYKLGLYKSHTKDCDLEECEKLHRLLAYQIIGR